MSNFTRENKLRILGVMGEEAAEVAYSVDGGYSETISAEKLLLTPAKFYLIEKAPISTETERRDLMNEVIRLSFSIVGKVTAPTLSRSEEMNVIYNIICDRYNLPIPMARISESFFTEGGFRSLVNEVNDLITKATQQEENNDSNGNPEKELIPEADEKMVDYVQRPIVLTETYDKNITLMVKGLSKEQCDKLVALAVAYTVENNLQSDNCSSLTIK